MKLNSEQRAGIAKLLGAAVCRAASEMVIQPTRADDHYLEYKGHYPILSDAELMLALLERVVGIQSCGEQVYELDIEWDRFDCAWDVTIRFEATEYVAGAGELAYAVVLCCLQLPEATPPTPRDGG